MEDDRGTSTATWGENKKTLLEKTLIVRNNCLENLEAGKFWQILQLPPSIFKPCNMWLWGWQPIHLVCLEAAGLNSKFLALPG